MYLQSCLSFQPSNAFLGGRRFYKSLWVYADVFPVSCNPSGVSSADHGLRAFYKQLCRDSREERRCDGDKQK